VSDPLVRILREAGHVVAEGKSDVLNLIHAVSGDDTQPLCSGFRVFPDGSHCKGCDDCKPTPLPSEASGEGGVKL
jgi:hypothetical protein